MKWRARWRRLRRKVRGALNGWKRPRSLPFPLKPGAHWSKDVNFTRNQSVLRINVVVNNDVIATRPREYVSNIVVNQAANMAREATRDLYA